LGTDSPTEAENTTNFGTQALSYTYDANGNALSQNNTDLPSIFSACFRLAPASH
jgi:YD repeat-containing protein